MPPSEVPPRSTNDKWKYALVGGLASIPFTATSYWQSGSEISLTPVLFGGLLAGYLAKRRVGDGRGVGARTGLLGGLPVLWMLIDILPVVIGMPNPRWFTVVGVGVAFGITLVGFGLAALIGELGGRIGGWLADRGGRGQQTRASS
ncbi:DUF5518 domain-containing protein [Haloarchaeobius sp. HRN-SO-5]|uniref:DUF5518 domain-containing protein n=1 Tax=Haloarchaeobius sp. HRN-SO-5 TaxID=3446118 RepID=UPI003EC0B05D